MSISVRYVYEYSKVSLHIPGGGLVASIECERFLYIYYRYNLIKLIGNNNGTASVKLRRRFIYRDKWPASNAVSRANESKLKKRLFVCFT